MPLPRLIKHKDEDPEELAEREINRKNASLGLSHTAKSAPQPIPTSVKNDEAKSAPVGSKNSFKETKALRKKRSRGVSGSSIKKDGRRFELGMENFDSYDDVSDADEIDNYQHCEKYINDNYSSYSNGIGSDSEYSNDSSAVRTAGEERLDHVCSALLNALTENGTDDLSALAEILIEEYDETGRVRVLQKALESITEDVHGIVVSDALCEYRLVSVIAKLVNEGLLDHDILSSFVYSAKKVDHPIALLRAASNFVKSSAAELRGDLSLKPPVSVTCLAKEITQDGNTCDVAHELIALDMPHFHSHFVHQVCIEAINSMNMDVIYNITGALRDMIDHKAISNTSVRIGFSRFLESINEQEVDLPGATSLATLLISYATNDNNLIDEEVYRRCPRPKRFLLKKANSCGKLSILDGRGENECNESNYFVMEN